MKKTSQILALILTCVLFVGMLYGCGSGLLAEKIVWDDIILSGMLPEPPKNKGAVHTNAADELWIDINNISDKQFNDYVEACKEKGFTVEAEYNSHSYDAFNADGYELNLDYYSDKLEINLEAPMELGVITWPTSTAGSLLPTPKSTIGRFSYEYSDNFFVYIGNTSKADYAEYVNACSEKGFNIDYNKGENHFYADDIDGWSVSVRYEGNNIMSIKIDAPDDENESNEGETDSSLDTNSTTPKPDTSKPSTNNSTQAPDDTDKDSDKNDNDSGAIGADFKAAMDSYEKFIDEYIAFLKKYETNPTDMNLLADYAVYIKQYAEFVEDFEKWENEEMNAAELAYYLEVQARVSKKLLETTN